MLHTLVASAALMGLAGAPHCLAMCGAASAAACVAGGERRAAAAGGTAPGAGAGGAAGVWRAQGLFHLGRVLSYGAAGALAAGSMGLLAQLGQAVAALRPLWTLVHLGALVLGLYLLWQGRQPAWMESLGRVRGVAPGPAAAPAGWVPMQGPGGLAASSAAPAGAIPPVASRRLRPFMAGLLWVAWPCGLLQSALLVAALADGPAGGAAVMAAFALASAAGLALGPAAWRWLLRGTPAGGARWQRWADPRAVVRLAGLMLAAASAWALGHGLWLRVWAWCVS